jgi:hypothetical protein
MKACYKLSIIQKHTNLKISENILTWKKPSKKPNILILNNQKTDIHEKKNWKHTTWKKNQKSEEVEKIVNGYYMKKMNNISALIKSTVWR